NQTRAIAVLGREGFGFEHDSLTGRCRDGHLLLASLSVGPHHEALAFLGEDFGPGGYWLGVRFSVDGSHGVFPFIRLEGPDAVDVLVLLVSGRFQPALRQRLPP